MAAYAVEADLLAAQKVGLRTGFVPRPQEHGPAAIVDTTPDPSFDVVATDFTDLARQMGV